MFISFILLLNNYHDITDFSLSPPGTASNPEPNISVPTTLAVSSSIQSASPVLWKIM